MNNLGIVVKCFQSERSSRQFLQFLRPTHQNFNFLSVSGRFDVSVHFSNQLIFSGYLEDSV